MSTLLNSYPIFENNQVLTSSQLNELVAYLDEQNRLTRVKLLGYGIVCGFDLKFNDLVTPYELTIFKGVGITSEGFLITEGDCIVRRYRPYTLPVGVRYVPFEDPDTTVQDVTLYELLTDDAPTLPTDVIKDLNDPITFVDDKVVLLFLECIDVDIKSCLGKACDENGIQRIFNLRKLLISTTDLDKVIARTCGQGALFPQQYDLPEIFMQRALYTNDLPSPNTKDYALFSQTYINALNSTASPAIGISIYNQLFKALSQTYTDFATVLGPVYGGVNPFLSYPSPLWSQFLNGLPTGGPQYLGVQYFYDFLKDLILAYNEFRNAAFDLMSDCCPDMDCFPKHLMLGEVRGTTSCKPSKYRHYFVYSQLFNNQTEKLKQVIFLHERMVLMTRKFDLATVNNPPTAITDLTPLPVPIYITPSNEKRDPLSMRSIPYYYRIKENEPNLGTLEQLWDYTFKQKCLFSKGLAPLAYGNQAVVQTNNQGPVKTPLFWDTDPYNFFRIEGAIGSNYLAVVEQIEKIKRDFDLPFNVIALRLSGEAYDNVALRCSFDDLRTEYGSLRTELTCMMNALFSRFGEVGPDGLVTLKGLPEFLQVLMRDANTGVRNGSMHQPLIGFTSNLVATGVITTGTATAATAATGTSSTAHTTATPGAVFLPGLVPVFAIQRTMNQVISKLNADMLNLVTSLNSLMNQYLPFNLTDFQFGYNGAIPATPAFIQNYFNAVQAAINVKVGFNQMLDLILRSTRIRNTPELYMDLSAYWSEVLGQLERFITDCTYESLTLLNYTYQFRITQLKLNDMTLFSNFIKKHPGIDHKAGVQPGGTFIVVYTGNPATISTEVRDDLIMIGRETEGLERERNFLMAGSTISKEEEMRLKQIDGLLTSYGAISHDVGIGIPIGLPGIAGDRVIADFSLPYLCCCDCECDEIPYPTAEAQLNMPALAVPFYVEYSLGDYAFGKDADFSTLGCTAIQDLPINIIPMLQYDKVKYLQTDIRLYLVDKNGNRVPFAIPNDPRDPIQQVSLMTTGNFTNQPDLGQVYGRVAIVYDLNFSQPQQFIYRPRGSGASLPPYVGVDSFYYMFEIVHEGVLVERSSIGKITMTISRSCG